MSAASASHAAQLGDVAYRDIRPASRSLAAVAAALAIAATLIVTFVPGLDSVQTNSAASAAIDTAATIGLALTCAIVAGRARRAASWSDLLLADGLLVMAIATLFLSVIPDLSGTNARTYAVWAGSATRLFAVALFIAGAVGAPKALEHPAAEMRRGLAGAAACTGLILILMAPLARVLPEVPLIAHEGRVSRDVLSGPTALTITEVLLAVGFLVASVGFARRSELLQDGLLSWVAAALALAGFSRLGYALFPSQGGDYLYIGDFLGLTASLVVLTGASIEVLGAQEALAEAAVRDDRRRIAHDLHDGLAQELAFITAQTRRLFPQDGADQRGEELLAAAERALEESRLAISGLARDDSQPLEKTLTDAATSTAARAGIEVVFDLEPGVAVSPEDRQAMLRVQSHAIVNAAVHGRARRVRISLRSSPDTRLSIADDGDGFNVNAPRRPDSIGLVSMEERAEALGGQLVIHSAPGAGTTIELVVPG
jgi:signal transduction histidine kinase